MWKPSLGVVFSCVLITGNAAILTVTTNADSGAGSLRDTIASANSGDTVQFSFALNNQVIQFQSPIAISSKDLTLDSTTTSSNVSFKVAYTSPTEDFFTLSNSSLTFQMLGGIPVTALSGNYGEISSTSDSGKTITMTDSSGVDTIYTSIVGSQMGFTKTGAAEGRIVGGITTSGTITASQGMLSLIASGAGALASSGSYSVSSGATLNLYGQNKGTISFARPIALSNTSSTLLLQPIGSTTLVLTSPITGTGVVWASPASSGVVEIDSGASIACSTLKINGTCNINTSLNLGTAGGVLDASGTITVADGVTLRTGGLTNTGSGTISLGAGAQLATGGNNVNCFPTFAISGSGSLLKEGTGILVLATTSTYSGGTTINKGAISITDGAQLGTGTVTINEGGSLYCFADSFTQTCVINGGTSGGGFFVGPASRTSSIVNCSISGTGRLTKDGPGNLALTNVTYLHSGELYVGQGNVTIEGTTSLASCSNIVLQGTLTNNVGTSITLNNVSGASGVIATNGNVIRLNNTQKSQYSGNVTGAGTIIKQGSEVLSIYSPWSMTGGVTISEGTIFMSGSAQMANSSLMTISSSGTLALGVTTAATIGSLTGSGKINLGTKNLSIVQGTDQTFSGSIVGTGGIIKKGSATLTLTGNLTYTGSTTVSAGILSLRTSGSSSSFLIQSGGTLDVPVSQSAGSIAGSGNITLSGGSLTITSGGNALFSGVISGSQGVTVTGIGTVQRLSGTNTYTGQTSINTGARLALSGSGSIASSSGLVFTTTTAYKPAVLDTSACTATVTIPSISSNTSTRDKYASIAMGTTRVIVSQTSNGTFNGNISAVSNATVFEKSGTGTLTYNLYTPIPLSAVPTFQVTQGTLIATGYWNTASYKNYPKFIVNGTLDLTGVSTVVASTISGSGTIKLGSAICTLSDGGSFSGDITGNDRIILDQAAELSIGSSLSYQGDLLLQQNSALTLAAGGDISHCSSLTMNEGFLIVNTTGGATVNNLSGSGSITVNSSLTLAATTSSIFTGTLGGSGSLTMRNTALSTLSGNSGSYTGTISLASGTSAINGSVGGDVNVASGATLKGKGVIGGTVTITGTVKPGASIGTLQVADLTVQPDGTVAIEITPVANCMISASNSMTLDGTLSMQPDPGIYFPTSRYTILNAGGSLSGSFAHVISTSSVLPFTVTYDYVGLQVFATSTNTRLAFVNLHMTSSNAAATLNNIEAINNFDGFASDPDLLNDINALVGRSVGTIQSTMEQLHPAAYSAFDEVNAQLGHLLLTQFRPKPIATCCPDPEVVQCLYEGVNLWVEPYTYIFHQQSVQDQLSFTSSNGGFLIGCDVPINKHVCVGGGGGFNFDWLSWKQDRGNAAVNSGYLGIYGDGKWESGFVGVSLMGGMDGYLVNRHIPFYSRDADGSHIGFEALSQLRGGVHYNSGHGQLTPFASFDYLLLRQNGFDERGAASLNLDVKPNIGQTFRSEVGVAWKHTYYFSNGCWSPSLAGSWQLEKPLARDKFESHFAHQSIPFAVRGYDKLQQFAAFSAECNVTTLDGFSFSTGYQIQTGKHFLGQAGVFRFAWDM